MATTIASHSYTGFLDWARNSDYAEQVRNAPTRDEKLALISHWILSEFDAFYTEFLRTPYLAEQAFEQRDYQTSLALSKQRLSMYSRSIEQLGPTLKELCPELTEREDLWDRIEAHYLPLIEGRYEADLTFAFIHSVRRMVHEGDWNPVEYSFSQGGEVRGGHSVSLYCSFPVNGGVSVATVSAILQIPKLKVPYRALENDAIAVAHRLTDVVNRDRATISDVHRIEMVAAGFYRNRGAYLVGRMVDHEGRYRPLIIALLNRHSGVYVDAVLTSEADAHNIFSSTLANFHVTHTDYHGLCEFLHSVMPARPLGLHYSTIGYNHLGKVAVMNELKAELAPTANRVFQRAVGYQGTVAIAFAEPASQYNLKVIRDRPTEQYKWGEFEGVPAVLRKYRRVHEINRTGSMLDNVIYFNAKLDRSYFDEALLDELLTNAVLSVSLRGSDVVFKHLIVQRRMTPLPLFLEQASAAEAETAIVNLGFCIKNNAAANIFNKDLDARNYGVSQYLKVYLFDYDALEPFTQVKIRTNIDREDGEEDIPDWYFEDGVVFLPEEIEAGLMLSNRSLRRRFREVHGDLLTTRYWERLQQDLLAGQVPSIRTYPEAQRLSAAMEDA